MGEVFRSVTAEVSPDYIEKFPSQFNIFGMLDKICADANVTVEYIDNVYNLKGPWGMITRAHSMLTSYVAVYGPPFSDVVQAAEAISSLSRGVELQEQVEQKDPARKNKQNKISVQHEMMHMDQLKQIPQLSNNYTYINTIPASIASETDLKSEIHVSTGVSAPAETSLSVNSVNNTVSVPEYYVQMLLKDNLSSSNIKTSENDNKLESDRHGINVITSETTDNDCPDIEIYVNSQDVDSSDSDDYNDDQEFEGHMQIAEEHATKTDIQQSSSHVNQQVYNFTVEQNTNLPDARNNSEMPSADEIPSEIEDVKDKNKKKKTKTVPHSCNFCEFVGKNRNSLNDHKNRIHLAKPTECDICKKIFPNIRYMRRHRWMHSEPQYKCDECEKVYKSRKGLKEHKKRHSDTYVRPEFHCKECKKVFCSNYMLECHVKSEHKGMKKQFLCQTCGKSFTTKHTLLQHANVHAGERPYKCQTCEKSFTYESALRDHKFIHEGKKNYLCEFPNCKKAFRQRSALKMHEKIHKEIKEFTCNVCNRGFTQKQALQRHERSHKGLKPYTCKHCNRTFGDTSIIRRHIKLVHAINKEENWREDIIVNPLPPEDTTKPNDASQEEQGFQTNDLTAATNASSFQPVSSEGTTRLPPVTTIQSFRNLEFPDHDLQMSHSLPVSQDGQMPVANPFTMTLPHHHDFITNQPVPVPQYHYTEATEEISQRTDSKTLEHTQNDESKEIHMSSEDVQHISSGIEKADRIQYLDSSIDPSLSDYNRWRYEGRSAHEIPGSTLVIEQVPDQQKICTTVNNVTVENKELSTKSAVTDVQDALFYTFYNPNVPTAPYNNINLNHFSGNCLPPTESTGESHVQ